MNDFDLDCRDKKRIASQARHRKRGSKSKKCSLSTDYMTPKQWRERNGKIMSVNLETPMKWNSFKELSVSLQEEYVKHLVEKYHANATSLSEMFGVSQITVRKFVKENGINVNFKPGRSMTSVQRDCWREFVNQTQKESVIDEEKEVRTEQKTVMTQFSLSFKGKIDIDMISNSLLQILGNDANGEIEIMCSINNAT